MARRSTFVGTGGLDNLWRVSTPIHTRSYQCEAFAEDPPDADAVVGVGQEQERAASELAPRSDSA